MEPTRYNVSGIWTVVTVVFWLIVGVLAAFTAIVPLVAVVLIIRALLRYVSTSVTLDEGGVTLRLGLLAVNETRFPIGNINTVSTSVNPIDARLDFGSLTLSVGNDRNQIKITNLGGCQDLKERLQPSLAR